jgi:integrative and conjugative element protein (TIGR02256 family)
METEYYSLLGLAELLSTDKFLIPRADRLLKAILSNRDYSIVGKFNSVGEGSLAGEAIVVDIVCHEVPNQNEFGIQFRERIAIRVRADEKQLVEVLALRKSFPTLSHQNYSAPNSPANLCLYSVPNDEVFRTWTAQNFLKRIQWWLAASSKGDLHAPDQPVEQLFFNAQDALVLPWNFDERKNEGAKFYLCSPPISASGKVTLFLEEIQRQTAHRFVQRVVEVTCDPIVHGHVEREPTNMGELDQLLIKRGVKLIPELKSVLTHGIDDKGISIKQEQSFTTIILHIPIVRETGGRVERFATRAYATTLKPSELGLKIKALFIFEGKAFVDSTAESFGKVPDLSWHSVPIYPMEVQYCMNASLARQQSSITDAGPKGVLVGYGSLGSVLLNLWTRSGWGNWSVIDMDHIKPHNLARHVALNQHIGQPKVQVASEFAYATYGEAIPVTAIYGDACDENSATIRDALQAAELVVDASAGMSYPRLASTKADSPRHVSCFLTPDGNKSVLLLEDSEGKCGLRTLEAQYYRAILKEEWGVDHLSSKLRPIRTGASCRDASIALPYSRVTAHASVLAEQIMRWSKDATARACVWEREEESGAVTARNIPIFAERTIQCGDFFASIDTGLEARLQSLRTQSLPNETGGVLLGYFDLNVNAIVIVDATSAPTDSVGTPSSFKRGTKELSDLISDASKKTAGIVGYVGEWHSHPAGVDARPSALDLNQLAELSRHMHDDGLPVLQLIVAEEQIEITLGEFK